MKYSMQMKLLGAYLGHLVKQDLGDRAVRSRIHAEYREILSRAGDIGSGNRLLSSYMLAAYFIAMNREDGLSPEENIAILEGRMRESRMLKTFMGDSSTYFSEKNMESRRRWSAQTQDAAHQKQYPNDWVVEVLEKTPEYQFGFDYTQCGVCKLCRDENCPQLAKYLCRLDYMLVEIMGLHLKRTTVLAEGGDRCDFRFIK